MTEQQSGVSPASAGGAPAPGPWDVGHSPATGGRNLYVRSADGDVYVGVIFEPDRAARIVEVMNEVERPLPPFKRRPVLGEPKVNMDGNEDGITWAEGVGWALSWGCQLTFGRTEETGVPYVQVSLSDEDRRRGTTQRTATRAQVAEFARMLAEQFGEPSRLGPSDGLADRIHEALFNASNKSDNVVEWTRAVLEIVDPIRSELVGTQARLDAARLNASDAEQQRDEAREEWKRADAEVTRQRKELERIAAFVGGSAAMPSSVRSAVEAEFGRRDMKHQRAWEQAMGPLVAERDRLRKKLDQHLADENSAQAANDRLRAALTNAEADRDVAQANERDLRRRLARIKQEMSGWGSEEVPF